MAKLLKKIEVGNPLINLGLMDLYDRYEKINTDEELANFYHKLLSFTEGSTLATKFAWAMIEFSTGSTVGSIVCEISNILSKDEN